MPDSLAWNRTQLPAWGRSHTTGWLVAKLTHYGWFGSNPERTTHYRCFDSDRTLGPRKK